MLSDMKTRTRNVVWLANEANGSESAESREFPHSETPQLPIVSLLLMISPFGTSKMTMRMFLFEFLAAKVLHGNNIDRAARLE